MFFQKVLKGIADIQRQEAEKMVLAEGIMCNWWMKKRLIGEIEVKDELNEINLIHHLNDYDKTLPPNHQWANLGTTYGEVSAFISTTAGAVQRDAFQKTNILFPPFMTALNFATNTFTSNGYIFYAYVMTLGKKSVELRGFSEEVRDLHTYTGFLPFHHEGEIVAKISIPSVNIQKAEYYDGAKALSELRSKHLPKPDHTIKNPGYIEPENFSNVRELL